MNLNEDAGNLRGSNAQTDIIHRFCSAAADGDIDSIRSMEGLLRSVSIDHRNEHGWTALMLAARNGHMPIIQFLLEKGADPDLLNKSGQSAAEIATFWNHGGAVKCIKQFLKPPSAPQLEFVNYFGLNAADRQSYRRKDTDYVESLKRVKSTKYIVFAKLGPLTTRKDGRFALVFLSYDEVGKLLEKPSADIIYIGKGCLANHQKSVAEGLSALELEDTAYFAISLAELPSEDELDIKEYEGEFSGEGYSSARLLMGLHPEEAGLVAQARSVLAWHDRYQFCPTCGTQTMMVESGYKRICQNSDCRSHKGVHNTCFPRIDPVVITLVVSPDGESCLLGRQARFPPRMYSCLAGFMEPGESIEDAARREVLEESGVKVGKLVYHSSQPWPFPGQLMIGFIGYAISEEIIVDREELEDARWFSRAEVAEALVAGFEKKDGLVVAPKFAIAHQLQKAWVKMSANL